MPWLLGLREHGTAAVFNSIVRLLSRARLQLWLRPWRRHGESAFHRGSRAVRSIVIEGWRFIPHSYAVTNQWQLLSLLKRGDLDLRVRDAPYVDAKWREDFVADGFARKIESEKVAPRPLDAQAQRRAPLGLEDGDDPGRIMARRRGLGRAEARRGRVHLGPSRRPACARTRRMSLARLASARRRSSPAAHRRDSVPTCGHRAPRDCG